MMSHRPEAWCPAQPAPSELEPAATLDRRGNIIGLADAPVGSMPFIPWLDP